MSHIPVGRLAGIGALKPLVTTFTLGADEPQKMAVARKSEAPLTPPAA